MPFIRIEYDEDKISSETARKLSEATKDIVTEATGIPETFVYANSSEIRVDVPPVEILIQLSAHKIENGKELVAGIKKELAAWKKDNDFDQLINLSLIPMHWDLELEF